MLQEKLPSLETGKQEEQKSLSEESLMSQERLKSQAAQLEHTLLANEQLAKYKEMLQEKANDAASRVLEESHCFHEQLEAAATQLAERKEKLSGLSSLTQDLDAKIRDFRRKSEALEKECETNGIVQGSILLESKETKAALKIQAVIVEHLAEEKRAIEEKLAKIARATENQAKHVTETISSKDAPFHEEEVRANSLRKDVLQQDDRMKSPRVKIAAIYAEYDALAGELCEREDTEMTRNLIVTLLEDLKRFMEKQVSILGQALVDQPLDTKLDREAEIAAPNFYGKTILPAHESPAEEPSASSSNTNSDPTTKPDAEPSENPKQLDVKEPTSPKGTHDDGQGNGNREENGGSDDKKGSVPSTVPQLSSE